MRWIPHLRIRVIGLIALLPPQLCIAQWAEHPAAIQTIYQNGVPHTDRNGVPLDHYDPARSFLPIGLYHALYGSIKGRNYPLEDYTNAGFNTLHLWEGQHLSDVADAAKTAHLQLIIHGPKDQEIVAYRDHPAVLAWYLDEEPTGSYWGNKKPMADFFADFVHRRDDIRKLDPRHPVFALDVPWITPPGLEWWSKWNTAGDVSAHDNYPITPKHRTISFENGIPQTVSLAVKLNNQKKPVWLCAQAFEVYSAQFPCNMPTPRELRAMTFAAFIHGATGTIDFALDSLVTREADVVGIAPDPATAYQPSGFIATQDQLRASRDLWNGAAALNKEIKKLTPVLLSPTSKIEYHVLLDPSWPPVSKEPICTLLKTDPAGGLVLLIANLDDAPFRLRIVFPGRLVHPQSLFDDPAAAHLLYSQDHLELNVGPYAVFALHL
jgi:hypothetical protein